MTTSHGSNRSELQWLASHRIDEGRLPCIVVSDVAAGFGTGERCRLCDVPISSQSVAYELPSPEGGRTLDFHVHCFQAWQLECLARSQPAGPRRETQLAEPGVADGRKTV